MLGRRTVKQDGKPQAKKRKWQEESDDDETEANITKADMEAWKATLREEEKEERRERERQEREERELDRKTKEVEQEKQKQQQEEEERLSKEAAEARKLAEEQETELRRLEAIAPPGALPPDVGAILPPGINPSKAHLYKTSYCKRWEQGNCNFGAACHFAHGDRDLRGGRARLPGATVAVAPQGASLPPPPPPANLQAQAALNLLHSMMASGGAGSGQDFQQAQWPAEYGSLGSSASTGAEAASWQGQEAAPWQGQEGWQQHVGSEAWHQPGGNEAWHLPGGGDAWQMTGDGHA